MKKTPTPTPIPTPPKHIRRDKGEPKSEENFIPIRRLTTNPVEQKPGDNPNGK